MNHECNLCHGKLKPTLTTFTQWYEGRLIVIERVPALVCEQCGETYYEPDVVERIQTLIWSDAEPIRMMETPVYQLE